MNLLTKLPPTATDKIAVIDIGSNSIRMVVYDGLKRVPLPLFNEKKLCGLARGMAQTGMLDAEGKKLAEEAIARYVNLVRAMRVQHIIVLATSAVRDAKDGRAFASELERQHHITVHILSGEEEAKYAGAGVVASFHDPDGVVCDLGGGSLELLPILRGKPAKGKSFPVGPLRLKRDPKHKKGDAKYIIDQHLKAQPMLRKMEGKTFYAVGGGFRTLAKIYMQKKHYPVRILHDYRMPAEAMHELMQTITKLPPDRLARQFPMIGKRAETLSLTALVADRILAYGKPKEVAFSVYGIREGYLYGMLSPKARAEDPLISACADMIEHLSPDNSGDWAAYGYELHEWMAPLFTGESARLSRLRLAACVLLRLAWYEHTGYRGDIAFRWVMDAQMVSVSHAERMFLALCIFHRYHSSPDKEIYQLAGRLLNKETMRQARLIGLAMRLGYNITGGGLKVLSATPISLQRDRLVLTIKSTGFAPLIGEAVIKRLTKLAEAFGLKPAIV